MHVLARSKKALLPVLDDLSRAVEGLVSSGLTTASAATRQKLDASFKEASRLKLLRLGAALRYVNDEIGRFLADNGTFSSKRLAFFLNRSWVIARGLSEAIRENDSAALARLLLAREPLPLKSIDVITVGVQKRSVQEGSCSFEFRLRAIAASGPERRLRLT